MVGTGGMLIAIGHDIQLISEVSKADSLKLPGVFFTPSECHYFEKKKNPLQSMTGIFSAKEALFKALAIAPDFFWTDMEVRHSDRHAPYFQFHGDLAQYLQEQNWTVHLSISHSGDYVSTFVTISVQQ